MPYAPTYRYAVGIYGANYAQPNPMEPNHWVMVETLDDIREYLRIARRERASWASHFVEMGDGSAPLDTVAYGYRNDGAYIYRVNRDHPDFSEVLDEPGDRARHAFGYVDFDYPAYIATFGARGGLRIERAS